MTFRRPHSSPMALTRLRGVFSPARALTQQEPVAKLESAGYSQIRDIKSTAEGTAVRAMKNGKFSGGPISLIAPRPEIGLGPVREEHPPCSLEFAACFVEGLGRAARAFPSGAAGIKTAGLAPRVLVMRP